MLTPAGVYYHPHETMLRARSIVQANAYELHSERFVRGIPKAIKKAMKFLWELNIVILFFIPSHLNFSPGD